MLSSTGLSPVDLLNLTIKDYLIATNDDHQFNKHYDIRIAIREMDDKTVIPTFKGHRQKSKTQYITFASPEAVTATNNYLIGRGDKLTLDTKLYRTSRRHLNKIYQDTNDLLRLGKTSQGICTFTPKNLRSFHATQLESAGMSDNRIDILEGRKPTSIIRKHYIKINVESLREEYIKCLPYLLVYDINAVKTELEQVKEENKNYKSNLDELWAELESVKNRQNVWEELRK